MPWILTCPWGHRWEMTGNAAPGSLAPCPVCGNFALVPDSPELAGEPQPAPSLPEEPRSIPVAWIALVVLLAAAVVGVGFFTLQKLDASRRLPAPSGVASTDPARLQNAPANPIIAPATTPLVATAPATTTAPAVVDNEPRPLPVETPGAVRIATLVVDSPKVEAGAAVRVTYTLRNVLTSPLSVTLRDNEYSLGRRSHAVERLGDDPRIKPFERDTELVGKRYLLLSRLAWSNPTVAPGESFRYTFDIPTDGLEPGSYRCWVSFKPLAGAGPGEDRAIDFEVTRPTVIVVATQPAAAPAPVVKHPLSEIDQAWKDAELDTLDENALARDQRILEAMRRGVDWLLTTEPTWIERDHGGFSGGYTALNTYSLLHVGHAIADPRLKYSSKEMTEPLDVLLHLDSDHTYVAGLQASALAMLPARKEFLDPLKRVQSRLLVKTGGAYSYKLQPATYIRAFDNSNTQYDNLGVWATADAGLEVPLDYWPTVEKHWRGIQCADGGWDYTNGHGHSTFTMTSAALASLLTASSSQLSDKSPYRDTQITNGFKELEKLFVAERGSFGARDGYGLYGMERVGLASGYKRFGTYDWYDEGAATALKLRTVGAYELLFLTRGRNPVVLNKLQYDGAWDARPWDAANLARWMSKMFEQPLNWQIITADSPQDDWMDAPVLLITGERPFTVNDALIAKLQAYIDAGGTVFSTTDKANPEFTTFIRTLANRVCRGRYELRDLPADHPLAKFAYPLKDPLQLMGMSNGIREVWLHSTVDLGADWQHYATAAVDSWSVPANIVLYTNGKAVIRRRTLLVDPTHVKPAAAGQEVTVAQMEYPGNWQPEPGVWPLFSLWARNSGLKVTSGVTTAEQLRRLPPNVLYMTGTARYSSTPELRTALAAYVAAGGTLFADAAGGRTDFAASFVEMLRLTFPNKPIEILDQNDELYPKPSDRTLYRRSWIIENGNMNQYRLRGIKINGRWAVIYSPDDIATGFLGIQTWGIQGYLPDVSRDLAANILRYAIKAKPAAQ